MAIFGRTKEARGRSTTTPNPDWVVERFPDRMYWWANAQFWRDALVAEARKKDPAAFTGPNKLRAFAFNHTLNGVAPDFVMVLVDTPRRQVVLAEFPLFSGTTVGASFLPGVEGDSVARAAASDAEKREASRAGLNIRSLAGPDGERWRVFTKELSLPERDLLRPDGIHLTPNGRVMLEGFVRDVLTAAGQWVLRGEADLAALQVEVNPEAAG